MDWKKLLKVKGYRDEEEIMLDFYEELKGEIMSTLFNN